MWWRNGEKEKQNASCAVERGRKEEIETADWWRPAWHQEPWWRRWGVDWRQRFVCHPGPWWCVGQAAAQGLVDIPGRTVARVCVAVRGSCCHRRPILGVWSASWSHVWIQGPHCCWGTADLSGLHHHLRPWWQSHPGYCWGPCLGLQSYCSQEVYDVHGPCCHQGPHKTHILIFKNMWQILLSVIDFSPNLTWSKQM